MRTDVITKKTLQQAKKANRDMAKGRHPLSSQCITKNILIFILLTSMGELSKSQTKPPSTSFINASIPPLCWGSPTDGKGKQSVLFF